MSTNRKEIESFVQHINCHPRGSAVINEDGGGHILTITVKNFPGLKSRDYEPINFAEYCRPMIQKHKNNGLSNLNYARCEIFKNNISTMLSILCFDTLNKSQTTVLRQGLKNMSNTLEKMLK